ncbi:YrhB domain-containing protein [Nocardia sp. NPDC051981]|uniref:YrhB domain-containing protein n=1 Tax=Nocardia sp. NPDC051981 TaxID=3155417 RepID=UPI00343269FB
MYDDLGDCWSFAWDSVDYVATGNWMKSLVVGPIVIPKNGSEVFVLGSAEPDEEMKRWRRKQAGIIHRDVLVFHIDGEPLAGASFAIDSCRYDDLEKFENDCLDAFLELKGMRIEFRTEELEVRVDAPPLNLSGWADIALVIRPSDRGR